MESYDNNNLSVISKHVNGKKDGLFMRYFTNGESRNKIYYL